MGFFDTLMATSEPSNWGPTDDRWYTNSPGIMTAAGVVVDAEGAQKLSAWFRGRRLLAIVLAMLPLPIYRKLPNNGGSEVATDHPLYDVLHDQPSTSMNSFEWRIQKMFDLIDTGWSFDFIVAGARGFAHELQHIPRRLVRPERIKGGPSKGRYLFHVTDEVTGATKTYTQDEIFYLRGPEGKGILERARMSIGTALATEQYAASIFGKGMLNGGTLEIPGVLNDDAGKRMAQSFVTKPGEWNMPKVLEQGAKWNKPDMSPEDFETILSRKFSIDDMARWLGTPRQMLENSDPSFGNAEQFDESFMTYTMGEWLALFEFAIKSQLLLKPRIYYAEFTRDAIARGKLVDRWAVHVSSVNAGIKTPNEARRKEGLNAMPGGDELREPQNITGKGTSGGPQDNQRPGKAGTPDSKAQAILTSAATRLLQLEATAIRRLAVRSAANADAFATAITEFYASHVARAVDMLQMSDADASGYCASQSSRVLSDWPAAVELFTTNDYALGLAAWALESEAA